MSVAFPGSIVPTSVPERTPVVSTLKHPDRFDSGLESEYLENVVLFLINVLRTYSESSRSFPFLPLTPSDTKSFDTEPHLKETL